MKRIFMRLTSGDFFRIFLFALMLQFSFTASGQTQSGNHIKNIVSKRVTASTPTSLSLDLPNLSVDQRRKVKSAIVLVRLKTGDFHQFSNVTFAHTVSFDIAPGNLFASSSYNLSVSNNKPQAVIFKSLNDYATQSGNFVNGTTPVNSITLKNIAVTGTSPYAYIKDSLVLEMEYDIEYGYDIKTFTTQSYVAAPTQLAAVNSGKYWKFTWDNNGVYAPNYQFQLLRLFNISKDSVSDEKSITAKADWSKALSIETQNEVTSLTLSIAEGQGYYLWRVRPVGSYYDGGIANSKNYSDNQWSAHNNTAYINVTQAYDNANPFCFFHNEPDDSLNLTHSRTFTEENRVKEVITYANGLQQVKQVQTYLPSKDTSIIVQNILDYSGRPSISTIPAPVGGKISGYKSGFVKSGTTDALYTAKDFDTETNYNNPSPVKQNSGAFSYYSDNNPDKSIPSAEGYPFTRILYYDDAEGRVKEQSGVGKTHMIGDGEGNHGGGKTVKTYYSTVTDKELIRLFGDEAPRSSSVFKTITIDQNNTASVSYTSIEGHVIATSLAKQKNDNAGAGKTFDQLDYEAAGFIVDDTIRTVSKSENFFIGSKKFVFLDTTNVKLDYAIACKTLQDACSNITLDCGFELVVSVKSEDQNIFKDSVFTAKPLVCSGDQATATWPVITLPPGGYYIEKKVFSTKDPKVQVADATDRIEKQIMPLVNMISKWLEDVKCIDKLAAFHQKLETLQDDINTIRPYSALDNKYRDELGINLGTFFQKKDSIYIHKSAGIPQYVEIFSPCCTLKVDVLFVPNLNCDQTGVADLNHNGTLEVNMDYFANPQSSEIFPDFEGYAVGVLSTCPLISSPQAALDTLQKYMNGWRPGEFNLMVYHMLTDRYNCDGTTFDENGELDSLNTNNPQVTVLRVGDVDECGDTVRVTQYIDPPCDATGCTQYKCDDLVNCWIAQVTALKEAVCVGFADDVTGDQPYNPSDGFDKENEGNKSKHDKAFDDNIKGNFILKWIIKKKASKKMRDLTNVGSGESETPPVPITFEKHLVNEFLSCTGMKFAKILSPLDPEPFVVDDSSGLNYKTYNSFTSPQPIKDRKYLPYKNWKSYNSKDLNADGTPKDGARNLFPNIYDPIYAFKYFRYEENFPKLEVTVCYRDPNDCYDTTTTPWTKVPCCFVGGSPTPFCDKARASTYPNIAQVKDGTDEVGDYKWVVKRFCGMGKFTCPVTHEMWTCGQRLSFFEVLRNYREVPDDEETNSDYSCDQLTDQNYSELIPAPEDKDEYNGKGSKALIDMKKMTTNCKASCESKRTIFATELTKLLSERCYVIGGCKESVNDNVVPVTAFNAMVDSLVSNCQKQCKISTYACTSTYCRQIDRSKFNSFGYEVNESNAPINESFIEYGVGGGTIDNCTPVYNGAFYNCSNDVVHSYCELQKYNTVNSSFFELEIESKCAVAQPAKFTYEDTEIECVPTGGKNPETSSKGQAIDPYAQQPVEEGHSNGVKITVEGRP